MRIGIVAIQGNVEEHVYAMKQALKLANMKAEVVTFRHRGVVPLCDALVLPGGESTTLSKLMEKEGISSEIKSAVKSGIPIMGTCAGLVLLAKHGDKQVKNTKQSLLELMDIHVRRNAFGRQRESFEAEVEFKGLATPFNAVFIRAPVIEKCGNNVEILSRYRNYIVAARQDHMLALAFHPELTDDYRIHQYFLRMVR